MAEGWGRLIVRGRSKGDALALRGAPWLVAKPGCGFYLSPSGARATPRKASPARAERMVTNRSRSPCVASWVALMRSVTLTSLLGSAPLSPLLLIVDVIA